MGEPLGTGSCKTASNDVRPGGRPGIAFRRTTPFAPFSQRRESQPAGDAAMMLLPPLYSMSGRTAS